MSGFGSFEPVPETPPGRGTPPRWWPAAFALWPVAALIALALVRGR